MSILYRSALVLAALGSLSGRVQAQRATAAGDTALARATLHRMMEAGPAESPAPDVATFEDHMRLVWGRKHAGLPPFAVSLCLATSERQ